MHWNRGRHAERRREKRSRLPGWPRMRTTLPTSLCPAQQGLDEQPGDLRVAAIMREPAFNFNRLSGGTFMDQDGAPTPYPSGGRYSTATDVVGDLLEPSRSHANGAPENDIVPSFSTITPAAADIDAASDEAAGQSVGTRPLPVPGLIHETYVGAVPGCGRSPSTAMQPGEAEEPRGGDHTIGRLRRVPLEEIWGQNAEHFTPWLQSNLDILDDAVGLPLTVAETEEAAPNLDGGVSRRETTLTGPERPRKVIVECQLYKSTSECLGNLITAVSAVDSHVAVWIVAQPGLEHVQVIDWLNRSARTRFYLLKAEAVRINDSLPAPFLTLIKGPDRADK